MAQARVVVVGVGNALRGDDAAGLEVVARVRDEPGVERVAHAGEPIELLEIWTAADAVVLVDTVRSGASPGTIHRLDASDDALPAALVRSSNHTIDVGEAIELARTLGRLPARVVVFGIEGARFDSGAALSPEVAAAIDSLADTVLREARLLLRSPPPGSRSPGRSRPPL
jgi:hydrogenase maturation protease